jgi:hypothetical protein
LYITVALISHCPASPPTLFNDSAIMEINFTTIILTLFLIFFISKSYSFARNYVAAVRTGYPVYISPVLSKSIPWMILSPVFRPQFKKWFPEWFYERLDVSTHG